MHVSIPTPALPQTEPLAQGRGLTPQRVPLGCPPYIAALASPQVPADCSDSHSPRPPQEGKASSGCHSAGPDPAKLSPTWWGAAAGNITPTTWNRSIMMARKTTETITSNCNHMDNHSGAICCCHHTSNTHGHTHVPDMSTITARGLQSTALPPPPSPFSPHSSQGAPQEHNTHRPAPVPGRRAHHLPT